MELQKCKLKFDIKKTLDLLWVVCRSWIKAEVTKMVTFADRKRKELTLDSSLMEISVKLLLEQKICTSIGKIDVIFSHTHQLLSALAYFDLKSMPRRQNWHFFMLMFGKFFSENSANNVQKLLVCYSFYSWKYVKRML